ncbi:bifunctional protein HldE [Hypericibacter adhaerens]|jgi:D-beta-D-heptose 7-phosphate kinase/D-beta-D-heptose 1-phosphate adenosyltransferase|uniref:Bifunctional protein HldE n=2 Tax=Hypericibacter adhaerens TaxID=2602016 RepID=A0A5J6MXT3_9PROT|nr:bifunctional D-glycero-beta-D-manno-heptose-7-phosphate kinase/D-glycero-beta-D-manno-heptose 1-phosphate adenylyltransferase HldE [Hypericibacter adhaerens]QEX22552.1 bifunctional protein HldE [Hypericibacter adhaerens]
MSDAHGPMLDRFDLTRFQQARILVLGDVMLDRYVDGSVERMSPEAPVAVLRADGERSMAGGAANVARNIAALGGQAILIGLVGQDDDGAALTRALRGDGGIEAHLITDAARPTTTKTRFVAGRQQLLRVDHERSTPANRAVEQELLAAVQSVLGRVNLVILSDYAKGALTDRVIAGVAAAAKAAGKIVIADPKSRDFRRYRGVDLLTPNRHEAAVAAGIPCGNEAEAVMTGAHLMEQTGIASLLITRGEQGMTLMRKGRPPLHLAADAREVFDVSGAGDTVIASLGLALATGFEMETAARFANLCGGIVVGKAGTALVHPADVTGALHARALGLSSDAKIMDLGQAVAQAEHWRASGLKVGFTNGCFDLIHPGHVTLLAKARAACDRLIVGLNSDASVRRLKGAERPIQDEEMRATVLAALASVDMVVIFEEDTPVKLIEALRPDLLVKGADYRLDQVVGADIVQGYGGQVLLVDLVAGHSTTATIKRLGRNQ